MLNKSEGGLLSRTLLSDQNSNCGKSVGAQDLLYHQATPLQICLLPAWEPVDKIDFKLQNHPRLLLFCFANWPLKIVLLNLIITFWLLSFLWPTVTTSSCILFQQQIKIQMFTLLSRFQPKISERALADKKSRRNWLRVIWLYKNKLIVPKLCVSVEEQPEGMLLSLQLQYTESTKNAPSPLSYSYYSVSLS